MRINDFKNLVDFHRPTITLFSVKEISGEHRYLRFEGNMIVLSFNIVKNKKNLNFINDLDKLYIKYEVVPSIIKDSRLKRETFNKCYKFANEFRKDNYLSLMAARGDLYVEVDKPHEILDAVKLIVDKDPDAMAGSRILLSLVDKPVPSCADLSELAWLYDIGYRRMLLCDELCLKDQFLSSAVNVFEAFKKSYTNKKIIHSTSRRSRRIGDEYLGGGVYLDRSSRFSQFDREFR